MEEQYPDLDDDFLKKIESEVQPEKTHDRSPLVVGKVMGWLFDQFIFNAHLFGEKVVCDMANKGQRVFDEYNRRYTAIDRAIVRAVSENDATILAEAKKESGKYDPNRFCAEVSRMNDFCQLHSASVERNCMQLNLRARSGIGLAAYFYLPALKWGLLKSLFKR